MATAVRPATSRNHGRRSVLGAVREVRTMSKLLLASALLVGISFARPAAAEAGFFFSFSQPGFGVAVGAPIPPPAYYYPPAPIVYVPPPVVYGGWYGHRHYSSCGHGGYAWGHGYRGRGHRRR